MPAKINTTGLAPQVAIGRCALEYSAKHKHAGRAPKQIQIGPGFDLEAETYTIFFGNKAIENVPVLRVPAVIYIDGFAVDMVNCVRIDSEVWTCPQHVQAGTSWDGQSVPQPA